MSALGSCRHRPPVLNAQVVLAAMAIVLGATAARGQEPQPPADPQAAPQPRVEEYVDVVAVTPLHGIGLPRLKVPANIQLFSAADLDRGGASDVADALGRRATSMQISEAQAGTFQPDVVFRGFTASPLLGASEGVAVYQDGVRINDPFGDTIQWDVLPAAAIASINLIPGSNPLFGLNALGAALSIRTKDGFGFAGHRAAFSAGSFGRLRLNVESGAAGASAAYFVAGELTDENGWRDFAPSTVRRMFGDVAWRGTASTFNLSVTAASNDLVGNGPAPVDLLEEDRGAVFTHPDRTDNDAVLLTGRGRRPLGASALLEGVTYFRHSRTGTFNGDAGEEDDAFNALNNISDSRSRAWGGTGQVTRSAAVAGRDNHFIAGAGVDAAATRFGFASELAELTDDRGTTRTGIFDEDAFVALKTRVLTWSGFVTNTWSMTDALSVTGSARFNWTDVRMRDQIGSELSGDHRFRRLNPAAGATYQWRPWLNLYGSYTQSSRVPTPVELTCADPDDPCRLPNAFVSDPPLNQVVGRTWESGVRGTGGAVRWTFSAFRTDVTDDIIFVSSGNLRGEGHFENVARTRRRGLEASVDVDVASRVNAFATYTFQRATYGTTLRIASLFHPGAEDNEIAVAEGDGLPGVPQHAAKVGISAKLTPRLNSQASSFAVTKPTCSIPFPASSSLMRTPRLRSPSGSLQRCRHEICSARASILSEYWAMRRTCLAPMPATASTAPARRAPRGLGST
jgi:iron complex outermembrane recepter protein